MDKDQLSRIRDNLETQLSELESLQSVFCNPGEIKVEDPCVLYNIKSFVFQNATYLPQYLDLIVNLSIENLKFQLCVTLPHEYPHTEPEVFVRNHKLNRIQHAKLNKDLSEYVSSLEKGEPCIFSAITWLQDNAPGYVEVTENNSIESINNKNETFVRFWIYSHHIYSKTKRKEILDLAHQLHVRGFCMPGKPGIICVEGTSSDCNEWWQSIKSMNWKKIFCKVIEEDKESLEEEFLKFSEFEEVVFSNSGSKFNHMDMGELFKYMDEHKVGYIFKEIFGVESKGTT